MLVVDSSVWIDFFNDVESATTELLQSLLEHGEVRLVVPDLVLFEVLRGFRWESDYRQARKLLEGLSIESASGHSLALDAAQHYRSLRGMGITVRSAIDVLGIVLHRERLRLAPPRPRFPLV